MAEESNTSKLAAGIRDAAGRGSLYTRERAQEIADELNAQGGQWSFHTVDFGYGSYIAAFDERHEYVGCWSDPADEPEVCEDDLGEERWPADPQDRVNPCTKCNRSWHADSKTNCADMCEELRAYRASFYSREAFEKIRREFEQYEGNLLGVKRQDYTARGDEDCLENFRQIAAFEGRSMPEVCLSQVIKHIQAIHRAVSTGRYSFSWEQTGGEGLRSRIADARNLLLLLAACLDHAEEGRGK